MSKSVAQLRAEADALLGAGRFPEAQRAYRALLTAAPEDPDAWYNLGFTERCNRHFEAALDAYGEALSRGVRGPEDVLVNRATILSEHLMRMDDAEAELKRAIALNPRHLPARLNLGNLYEDLGDADRARRAYADTLTVVPNQGRALARLAILDSREGKAAAAVDYLTAALARSPLRTDDSSEIAFALGHALDRLGEYDRAFGAFDQANQIIRNTVPSNARYDRAAHERMIDTLIQTFPLAASADATGDAPVFILGLFRSGSTLAEQILGRHPSVKAGGELETIPAMASRLSGYPHALSALGATELNALRSSYEQEANRVREAGKILTDKRPDNFLHLGLIRSIFPAARVIHTTRHPLDNLLSIYFLNFDPSISYGFDLADIAHFTRQQRRLMRHWAAAYGDTMLDANYDRLVTNPQPETQRMLAHLGLDWAPECLSGTDAGPVKTASVWQVREPIHQRSSGRWQNYARHLAPVMDLADA